MDGDNLMIACNNSTNESTVVLCSTRPVTTTQATNSMLRVTSRLLSLCVQPAACDLPLLL